MQNKRLILVTNDDGYNSKGIAASVEVARKFGDVIVLAPETHQSGMSQAITMYSPLYLRKVSEEPGLTVYAFSGTPVDCVKMAFNNLLKDRKIDLVLSGINHGSNAAINVLYSGTMGAAIEGSFYNIPSIGLSLLSHDPNADFDAAKIYAEQIVHKVLNEWTQYPLCLNVNIPVGDISTIKGIKVCRQNKGFWKEELTLCRNPHGREYYWLSGYFMNHEPESTDTDEWALANGYVSVVPIQVDMTNYNQLKGLSETLG